MENVNFNIFDRLGTQLLPMTGYSLPFEKFRFVPNFASVGNYISNKKVIWNFGDGTTSTDLTAFHSYNYPGNYPITLTVFNSSGDSTRSSYTSAVQINNFVNCLKPITKTNTIKPITKNKNYKSNNKKYKK